MPTATAPFHARWQRALVYLRERPRPSPLTPLLALLAMYTLAEDWLWQLPLVAVLGFGVLQLIRAPRWAGYACLWLGLLVFLVVFLFDLSTGPIDPNSDRDDQVEIGEQMLLDGQNPWSRPLPSGNANSAGPSSFLIAAPWVALFGRINEMTFVFYLLLFAFLMVGDVTRQNDAFPLFPLFVLCGLFGFTHTLLMGLEELYFGFLILALAWVLVGRNRLMAAGACLAIVVAGRLSYAFPAFAFLSWYLYSRHVSRSGLLRLVIGGSLGLVAVMAPYVLLFRADLIRYNPWIYAVALLEGRWPKTNPVFRLLNGVEALLGPGPGKIVVVLACLGLLLLVARSLSRLALDHPFWHVCLGGFIANMVAYLDPLLLDYILFFVIPGFMAIAFSGRAGPPRDACAPS